jgi:predicted negative regulator of RcsB-dependent stress response
MRTMVYFEKWDEILDGAIPEYKRPREQAWLHWARGLALASRRDERGAKAEAAAMDAAIKELAAAIKDEVPAPLAAARHELDGHILYAARKTNRALRTLEAAARKERALRYSEPPSYPRPVFEVLGRLALAHGNLPLARTAFREALEQFPASPAAARGLEQTLARIGGSTRAAAR